MEADGGEEVVEAALDDAAQAAMAAMGLPAGGFGSSKGKAVAGNGHGVAKVVKKRRYRQYMNRVGGFNRPLDGE